MNVNLRMLFYVFFIYVWVKKCVNVFKIWKNLFEKGYQTALKKTVMASALQGSIYIN